MLQTLPHTLSPRRYQTTHNQAQWIILVKTKREYFSSSNRQETRGSSHPLNDTPLLNLSLSEPPTEIKKENRKGTHSLLTLGKVIKKEKRLDLRKKRKTFPLLLHSDHHATVPLFLTLQLFTPPSRDTYSLRPPRQPSHSPYANHHDTLPPETASTSFDSPLNLLRTLRSLLFSTRTPSIHLPQLTAGIIREPLINNTLPSITNIHRKPPLAPSENHPSNNNITTEPHPHFRRTRITILTLFIAVKHSYNKIPNYDFCFHSKLPLHSLFGNPNNFLLMVMYNLNI